MKKLIFYILPVFTFLLTVENVFVDIQFQKPLDPYRYSLEEGTTNLKEQKNAPEDIRIGRGIFRKILFFSDILTSLKDENSPSDGKPEKTIGKLERVILSQKIGLLANLFLSALSISSIIAIFTNAFFSPFLNRVHAICSIFLLLQYITESMRLIATRPVFGILGAILFFAFFILAIWIFRKFGKIQKIGNFNYMGLYHASKSEEESAGTRQTDSISFANILFHFTIIIFAGIFIGNFLYIPLFSLQKNYSAQFNALLIFLFLGLSLFYVRNYYRIGKENSSSKFQNILASASFLQFRFIKNILMTFLSLAGVVFFISLIFSLLAFNTFILKSANFLLHTQASL